MRAKEDIVGQQKLSALQNHYQINGIKSIKQSILWQLADETPIETARDKITSTHLLYNPNAYDYYQYDC